MLIQYVYHKNPKQTAQGQTHVTGIQTAIVSIASAVKRSIQRPDQFELPKKWLKHSMPKKKKEICTPHNRKEKTNKSSITKSNSMRQKFAKKQRSQLVGHNAKWENMRIQ